MVDAKNTMVIAAPTIAEIMRFGDGVPLPRTYHWEVASFGRRAAELVARIFPEQIIRAVQQEFGFPLDYIRYDAMIVAVGLVERVSAVVTLDGGKNGVAVLARRAGMPAYGPEDFKHPPSPQDGPGASQLDLPFNKPPSAAASPTQTAVDPSRPPAPPKPDGVGVEPPPAEPEPAPA